MLPAKAGTPNVYSLGVPALAGLGHQLSITPRAATSLQKELIGFCANPSFSASSMNHEQFNPALKVSSGEARSQSRTDISRRRFLAHAGQVVGLALANGPALCHAASPGAKVSISEAFDREINEFMSARAVPGGSLAVIKDGRLVYARGYGLADREKRRDRPRGFVISHCEHLQAIHSGGDIPIDSTWPARTRGARV